MIFEDKYPATKFQYANYNVDPKPHVLVLGTYRPKTTGNNLLAGINLNYLSKSQLRNLQRHLNALFSLGDLRSRYRYISNKLQDISQYYRTYDKDEISSVEPDELSDAIKPKNTKKDRVQAVQKPKADIQKLVNLATTRNPDDIDNLSDRSVDSGRNAWQMKQRLYNTTGNRQKPEASSDTETSRLKGNRYRSQRRELNDLKRQAEIDRIAAKLKKNYKPDDKYEDTDDLDNDLDNDLDSETPPDFTESVVTDDYSYFKPIGFVWSSPDAYIKWHNPPKFSQISESIDGKVSAIYNLSDGMIIVDKTDHDYMLFEAGWSHDHTVLFERDGDDLVVLCDLEDYDLNEVVDNFVTSDACALMASGQN